MSLPKSYYCMSNTWRMSAKLLCPRSVNAERKANRESQSVCVEGNVKPSLEPAAALSAVALRSQWLGGRQVEAVPAGCSLPDASIVRLLDA